MSPWLSARAQDLRFASRILRKDRGATAVAILTITLGVGLNTALLSVVESIVLRDLPYGSAARLVSINQTDYANPQGDGAGGWTLHALLDRSRLVERISAYNDAQLTLVEAGRAEVFRGLRVSDDFFETLGVTMQLGRSFLPEEGRSPPGNVVILTHGLWTRRFGADPAIVGRTLNLNAQPYRVIGVLPSGFRSLRMRNQAEIPQVFAPAAYDAQRAAACIECFGGRAIGLLKPSVPAAQAEVELGGIMRDLVRTRPDRFASSTTIRVTRLLDDWVGPVRGMVWAAYAGATFVLLIACTNVASLQLARAAARRREFAVRTALGGERSRLAWQLVSENVLLAILGGGPGALLGAFATPALASLAPAELPRLEEIHLDARVLVAALAITLVVGLIFGLAPAWYASRVDANDALKRTSAGARSTGSRLQGGLVVFDLALAFVLVAATALLGETLRNLRAVDAGFDAADVLTLTPVISPNARYGMPEARLRYYRDLVDAVSRVPGVTSAGMVSNVPLSHAEPFVTRVEGQLRPDVDTPTADVFWASPGYFEALRFRLVRGRLLAADDGASAPAAALVSESFARARFPGVDPVGRRIQVAQGSEPWTTIVGVVGDVRYDALDRAPRQAVYLPQAMNVVHYTRLVARASGDPARVERAVLAAIHALDPTTAVFHVQRLEEYVSSSLADRRFALTLVSLFASLGLLLAAVGVYGLSAHAVVQRTPELGIRAALGATRWNLFGLVLSRAGRLAIVGLAAGLPVTIATAGFLRAMLYGVQPWDPRTLVATAAALAAVALIAAAGAARRALQIEPLAALRTE